MTQNAPYQFSPEKRSALEALPHALAAYQYVGGSVKTLLVSDGMCRFSGRSRAELFRERGRQFDPQLVDVLLTMIDEGLLEQE